MRLAVVTPSMAFLVAVAPALAAEPAAGAVRVAQAPGTTVEAVAAVAGSPAGRGAGPSAPSVTGSGKRQTPNPAVPSVRPLRRRVLRPQAPPSEVLTVVLPGDVPLELVRIAGGRTFMMGAPAAERGSGPWEMPQHPVTIARDFYLGRYEVTQAQWQALMGANPAHSYGVGFTFPVYYVSWDDIAGPGGFIERLNLSLDTTAFRLPTEAEWEYAARGGTTTEFSFPVPAAWDTRCGGFPAAERFMWWCGTDWLSATPEVGQKLPNPWGLYDVSGNVWEWVQDWFHPSFTGAPSDGSAWEVPAGTLRIVRGGAWNAPASYCRSAERLPLTSDHMCFNTGFRLARSH